MLFIFFFISALLVVPIMLDAAKHGDNHILRRAGSDLANLEASRKLLTALHVSATSIRGMAATTVSVAAIVLFFFAGWQVLRIAQYLWDFISR